MEEKNFWDITLEGTRPGTEIDPERPCEADVIVVGGGASGLLAAVRAAECGAKVAIVDKCA